MLRIYTDGSSTGRANREGGWAFVVTKDGAVLYSQYGGEPHTTNNLMEIEAAIQAMCWLINNKIEEEATIITDSQYVKGILEFTYTPKKNLESCELGRKLITYLKTKMEWVKGHSGDEFNDLCDQLAKKGKEKYVK